MRWWAAGLAGSVALLVFGTIASGLHQTHFHWGGDEYLFTLTPMYGPTAHCITFDRQKNSYSSLQVRRCVKLRAPAVIEGFWLDNFEGSDFFASKPALDAYHPGARTGESDTWLEIDDQSELGPLRRLMPRSEAGRFSGPPRAYKIAFIGRRAELRNDFSTQGYGHMGAYPDMVLVDRVLSAKLVGETSNSDNPR